LATAHALALDDSHDARTILVMTLLVPMAKDPPIATATWPAPSEKREAETSGGRGGGQRLRVQVGILIVLIDRLLLPRVPKR
jgi:hypothetical protein